MPRSVVSPAPSSEWSGNERSHVARNSSFFSAGSMLTPITSYPASRNRSYRSLKPFDSSVHPGVIAAG